MKKIVTIIGARPQFVKAAVLSKELKNSFQEIVVHTGQHYDKNMSDVFFEQLNIEHPAYNLEIGSYSHGKQTGMMLEKIESVLMKESPSALLIYGDTNSTVAGALAAAKLHIPVVHVEAGLRSFNRKMPEEINRIVSDQLSELLFCPTQTAVDHLNREGIEHGVYLVGDVMYDLFEQNRSNVVSVSDIADVSENEYYLATIHRPYNTDFPELLEKIFRSFTQLDKQVVLPLHPRTRKKLDECGLSSFSHHENIVIIPPVGYTQMQSLELSAYKIITDSGGVQKEAYFAKKQCFTYRYETEWVETCENNWNILCNVETDDLCEKIMSSSTPGEYKQAFGNGDACVQMSEILKKTL